MFLTQNFDISESYPVKQAFSFFCNVIALTLGYNKVKGLRVTQILKKNNVGGFQDELESKKVFERQAVTKYLRLTLVST